jgi:two-component system, cell cycle response regulator DivK
LKRSGKPFRYFDEPFPQAINETANHPRLLRAPGRYQSCKWTGRRTEPGFFDDEGKRSTVKQKILVIEDNPLNMKLVRVLLGAGSFEVIEAVDAEKGIALARTHHPDLILMDVQLPGMDGLCATRAIKKDPELTQTPIVAVTSFAMAGDEQKAREAGCTGYLTKPIDTRTFLEEIIKCLPRKEGPEWKPE